MVVGQKSIEAFEQACKVIPGGVNSPVRSFKSVGSSPVFIDRAQGALIWDVDGKAYIDYVGSWGPMILGHGHPTVLEAVKAQIGKGLSFGAATELETRLAEKVCQAMPNIEMIRFVSSGTEATMSALRVARGFTGRDKIIKLEGCYHGHGDMLLAKAGSGLATLGIASANPPGVTAGAVSDTLLLPYNDLAAAEALFAKQGSEIAALILEPIIGNAGFILPESGYLQGLRDLCDQHGSLLIFDEVMTGSEWLGMEPKVFLVLSQISPL